MYPLDSINRFIIRELNPLVDREYSCTCRFQIHVCILACVMSREFTRKAVKKFLQSQFPWIWCKWHPLRNLIHSKICNLTKYRKVLLKYSLLITHAGMPIWIRVMTNGFIFQLINSLIECWGVRLTCLDCKALDFDWFSPQPYSHQKTTKHKPYSFYNHRSTEWLLHEIYVSDKSKRGSTFPCVYTDIRHFRLPREGREEGMIW